MKSNQVLWQRLQRIKALIVKEYLQILRDPSSLIIATIFPIFLLCMYGYGVSLDIKNIRVGIIQEDSGNSAQSLVQAIKDSRYFSTTSSFSMNELKKQINNFELDAILWIPSYFSDFLKKNSNDPEELFASVLSAADGSSPNTCTFTQNYILAAWGIWLQQMNIDKGRQKNHGVLITPRFWFNEELDSKNFLVPGSIAIAVTLIGTLLTALMIAREWERGTMEALMTTKVTILEILLGKLIPYFVLGCISVTLCTLIGHYVFAVPLRGSLLVFAAIAILFLLVALGIGLLISSSCKDQFNAAQIAIITAFLPAFMLSGFIFEISSMPFWIRTLTHLLAPRYFVQSLQTLFLTGDVYPLILYNGIVLFIFCMVLFFVIIKISKKRLD